MIMNMSFLTVCLSEPGFLVWQSLRLIRFTHWLLAQQATEPCFKKHSILFTVHIPTKMQNRGIKRPLHDTYDEENDKGEEESDGEKYIHIPVAVIHTK